MTADALPMLVALAGTLAGCLVTWLVARRRTSGGIRTSEASTLWAAAEALRRDLTDALRATDGDLTAAQASLAAMHTQMAAMTAELAELRAENARFRIVFEKFRTRMEGD